MPPWNPRVSAFTPDSYDLAGFYSWRSSPGLSPGRWGRSGRIFIEHHDIGGMIAATTLNLVFIPVLYIIIKPFVPGRVTVRATTPEHATD